jgi:hypothetical protein
MAGAFARSPTKLPVCPRARSGNNEMSQGRDPGFIRAWRSVASLLSGITVVPQVVEPIIARQIVRDEIGVKL